MRIYKDLKGSDSMATTKEYKKFILEQLDLLDHITCRPMMGGYLIYYNDILFGGLYGGDNFLVKMVESNKKTYSH